MTNSTQRASEAATSFENTFSLLPNILKLFEHRESPADESGLATGDIDQIDTLTVLCCPKYCRNNVISVWFRSDNHQPRLHNPSACL
jgi:hypothetical protein